MKILYITLVTLVFIGSFFLGLQVRAKEVGIKLYDIGSVSALPVLTENNSFPILSGQGVIAVDKDSGVTLYEKSADAPLYPASTTKIITALVSFDYYKPSDIISVINPTVDGQKIGLFTGEKLTFDSLINALLIYSANDAAITLSDNFPGGRNAFVDAMNSKAQSLHLDHSHFANPVGLDDPTQVTTARDMVRLSAIAMQNPYFASIVGTREKVIRDVSGKYSYDLTNVNQLLGVVPGVEGIKTGWTEEARENLITYVERDNHKIYIALLGSEDRFGETKELIDWIYGSFVWKKIGFVQKAVGMMLR